MTAKKKAVKKKLKFFLVKFFLIFGMLYLALYLIDSRPLQEFVALNSARLIGLDAESNTVMVGSKSFLINESCTGFVSIIILASTIFSLRKPGLNKKMKMFFAGSIALFFLNIARVSLVLLVGLQSFQAAELAHVISWFLMSAAIIALWYYSTKKIVKIKRFNELL